MANFSGAVTHRPYRALTAIRVATTSRTNAIADPVEGSSSVPVATVQPSAQVMSVRSRARTALRVSSQFPSASVQPPNSAYRS